MIPNDMAEPEPSVDRADGFESEIRELELVSREIDELYNELKEHFDQVRSNWVSGSLTFIARQSENLIGLKRNKADIIKDKAIIKKYRLDHEYRSAKFDSETDSVDSRVLNALLDRIRAEIRPVNDDDPNHETVTDNSDVDATLDNKIVSLYKHKADQTGYTKVLARKGKKMGYMKLNENHPLVKHFPYILTVNIPARYISDMNVILLYSEDKEIYWQFETETVIDTDQYNMVLVDTTTKYLLNTLNGMLYTITDTRKEDRIRTSDTVARVTII